MTSVSYSESFVKSVQRKMYDDGTAYRHYASFTFHSIERWYFEKCGQWNE